VLAVTLPDWINPDNARNIALGVGVVALVLGILVLRFVQKIMMKVALSGLLLVVALVAWAERADLNDCAKTCECRVLWQDIKIPPSNNPNC
jgi:hypothetical protein